MESPLAALLWRSLRLYQVFGANTEVGKTVFTTLLCRGAKKQWADEAVGFLKPVSTGPMAEADDRHVQRFAPEVTFKTLFQYGLPISPHSAALVSGQPIPSDEALLRQCRDYATQSADQGHGWLFMETAGGVHSPGPSGTTQADMYTPLRIPVVLIGDSKLGGISQTISAYESLRIRGYDVEAVLLFKDCKYENFKYLAGYFQEHHGVCVASTEQPPERRASQDADVQNMMAYYEEQSGGSDISETLSHLSRRHNDRIESLESLPKKALDNIWYPFTQQKLLEPKDIMVIDSAHGDYFQTVKPASAHKSSENELLRASFDGSASWWTQGLGHANPQLTLAAAYAAGRYGHVMFAGAVHEPASALAETLLQGMDNPRLSRVFFSDNGSTGIEVSLKMGLRAAKLRYGWASDEKLGVLGLKGGYHGDTIGAMDCAEPCGFNEKVEWYEGKGFWFDYPTVMCTDGAWQVNVAEALRDDLGDDSRFTSLQAIFDVKAREEKGEHHRYREMIAETLARLQKQGCKFGALILEPIVLGAGGMAFVDPLFQRTLVNVVRESPHLFSKPGTTVNTPTNNPKAWTGLPVIFDEVFTGLYRLGRFTPSSFLQTHPDISVHAKLLTGGLVPLCTTLASEDIFQTFSSSDKTDALLHGHSYTAHPVGCQVALEAVKEMQKMENRGDWDWAKQQAWLAPEKASASGSNSRVGHEYGGHQSSLQTPGEVWSVWPYNLVGHLSRQSTRVSGVWALGSVLAIHMKDASGSGGYFSDAAQSLRDVLVKGEAGGSSSGAWNVHCRVLGNVLYVMAGQKTGEGSVQKICELLRSGF